MPYSIDKAQNTQVLRLEGAVTIRDAQELAARLGQGLEDGMRLTVDTSGLEDIDTCILQLLYSLRKTVPELAFENPSAAFISAVDRCGLRRELPGGQEDL